jgi:hypothetical protein
MLTLEALSEILNYDASRGEFFWKKRLGPRCVLSKKIGSQTSAGYVKVMICRKHYLLHRLVWLFETGEWPAVELDHINGVRNDNRFVNLRLADRSINTQNRHAYGGVSYDTQKNSWRARITTNGKCTYLGRYKTEDEARRAYLVAKQKIHIWWSDG